MSRVNSWFLTATTGLLFASVFYLSGWMVAGAVFSFCSFLLLVIGLSREYRGRWR